MPKQGGTAVLRLLTGQGLATGGEHDYRNIRRGGIGLQQPESGQTVHHRHDDIEDEQIRKSLFSSGDDLRPVCACSPRVAAFAQRHFQQPQHVRGVFGDDETGHSVRRVPEWCRGR